MAVRCCSWALVVVARSKRFGFSCDFSASGIKRLRGPGNGSLPPVGGAAERIEQNDGEALPIAAEVLKRYRARVTASISPPQPAPGGGDEQA